MNISDISIYDAEIKTVGHSAVTFSNSKATVNMINIKFATTKYSDKIKGSISIDRKQALKLIKELKQQVKIRSSDNHIRWDKRKVANAAQ